MFIESKGWQSIGKLRVFKCTMQTEAALCYIDFLHASCF